MSDTHIHTSGDGSHTVWSDRFRQYYHNPNGAVSESRHVFFDTPDLTGRLRGEAGFSILEIGFGTGLNLLILAQLLQKMEQPPQVTFRSVEAFPLTAEQAAGLNYGHLLNLSEAGQISEQVFAGVKPGLNRMRITDRLDLELFVGPFNEMPPPEQSVQAILFDPFSPDVNPDLWTPDVFRKLGRWSAPDVLLATYGAASSARAAMAVAGWHVARAPGALGKREMTLAALDAKLLAGRKLVDGARLAERWHRGDFE